MLSAVSAKYQKRILKRGASQAGQAYRPRRVI